MKYAASLAGLSYTKLIQLNPGFNRLSTSTKGPAKLVLPIENIEQFTENLAISPLHHQQMNWIHYRVKSGDTLVSITKKFNITADAIRKMNHLTKNTLHPGIHLLIPVSGQTQPPAASMIASSIPTQKTLTVASTQKYTLQPGDTIYMIRKKDTIQNIAKRFHLTIYALRTANQSIHMNGKLKPGKQIIIPTHHIV